MSPSRRNVLVTTLAIALSLAAGACASGASSGTGATSAPASVPASGAAAYAFACASCHGADGGGGQGPAIGRTLAASKYDQASLEALITTGKGAMEGYQGDLPPATIALIADYVRTQLGT